MELSPREAIMGSASAQPEGAGRLLNLTRCPGGPMVLNPPPHEDRLGPYDTILVFDLRVSSSLALLVESGSNSILQQ